MLLITHIRKPVVKWICILVTSFVQSYGSIISISEGEAALTYSVLIPRFIESVAYTFLGIVFFMYYQLNERKQHLIECNEINLTKMEYNAILENLKEVVITKSDENCLKYFNSLGFDILNSGVNMTENPNEQAELLKQE